MDRFLAGDGDLLVDCSSDLPMLSLPLLPLPVSSVSSPESVVAHSPVDQFPSSTAASPDLYREGPFDVSQSVSVSGAAPLVLNSLPGCQYQMTSYDNTDMTDVDPAYGLQLHHSCFLEYVRAP